MGIEENKEKVRRGWDGFNKGNLDHIDEDNSPDCIYHDNFRILKGTDAIKGFAKAWKIACPDLHITVDNIIGEGDYVAVRYTAEGTFTNQFADWKPTGNRFKYATHDFIQFKDGIIVEQWSICNELDFLQQLGVLPSPDNK